MTTAKTPTPPEPTTDDWRCDELLVQVIQRRYDANGVVAAERVSQPFKVFRGAGDVWTQIAPVLRQGEAPGPSTVPRGRRRRRG